MDEGAAQDAVADDAGVRAGEPTPNQVGARRDGSVRVRGVELRWTDEQVAAEAGGQAGPTNGLVVAAHGLGGDRWSIETAGLLDWSPVVRTGRRVVRYDARGHGRSDGRPVADDYRWPDLAADLLALLDVLSPDAPVSAVGASMGTATLLHAALAAPHRFERLVLACPPTAWATRAAQADLYRQGADLVEQHGTGAFEQAMAAQPPQGLFAELPPTPPRLFVRDALLPSVLRGAAASDLPGDDELRSLDLPVLVLSWYDDPGHPVATGEHLRDVIDGAELATAASVAELRSWGPRAARFLDAAG